MQDEKHLHGIKYINYLGELDWKISAGYETIWMVLTLSIILKKIINYLGWLDWKINVGWENQDGVNLIDYLGELDCKINTDWDKSRW